MGTTTTTYALNKPTVGGDENAWGTDLNTNADKIDDLFDGTIAIKPNLDAGLWKVGGVAVTSSAAELNALDGVTASPAELNIMDGVTATTAEINKLAGTPAGLTSTEIGYLDGVTSAIQTQLDAKQALDSDLTAIAGLASNGMISRTGSGTAAARTITAGAGISVTNGDGVSGNPTISSGARVLLATKTASASATLDFTEFNNATYRWYEFELEDVKPATDLVFLQMRFSTDGGATYDSGASAYDWAVQGWTSTNSNQQAGAVSTFLGLTHNGGTAVAGVGNAATEFGVSGKAALYSATSASSRSRVITALSYDNGDGNALIMNGSGRRNAAQDTDAVRFLFSSGNITSGTIRMYGLA